MSSGDMSAWPINYAPIDRLQEAKDRELFEQYRRIASVKLELRFGPNSDIAQMLGLPLTPAESVALYALTQEVMPA